MSQRKKVLLVLPRGEAIRNFVLSGTADEIKKTADLAIISVVPNEELKDIMLSITNEFYELEDVKEHRSVLYLRDWLDVVHGRFLWSGVAKFRWKLRDHEARSFQRKLKRNMQKTVAYPFANRLGVALLSGLESYLSQKIYPVNEFVNLLRKIKPDLVFNGSHIHSRNALPIIHAAKKLKIKTATFIFSWDNLTSQGRVIPSYNYYMVWNKSIYSDLLKIYNKIKPEQISITGTPQFDFHFQEDKFWSREEYCKKIGADPSRPIILYTTGMLNLMPGEEVIVENIGNMLLQLPDPKPQLVVRVYPKETSGRFEPMKARRPDIIFPNIPWERNFFTPMPEDLLLWSNMLKHCELGINVASTVALELAMFDKPVINVAYNPPGVDIRPKDYPLYYTWDHYVPIVESGAVALANNEAEMGKLISQYLAHPEQKGKERKDMVKKFFGEYLDGQSYKRIADNILSWAGYSK